MKFFIDSALQARWEANFYLLNSKIVFNGMDARDEQGRMNLPIDAIDIDPLCIEGPHAVACKRESRLSISSLDQIPIALKEC
ncbi:hypothetical protein D3C72_2384410 [compost metagenome]